MEELGTTQCCTDEQIETPQSTNDIDAALAAAPSKFGGSARQILICVSGALIFPKELLRLCDVDLIAGPSS